MLPQQERLRFPNDFQELRRQGHRYNRSSLTMVLLKENSPRCLAGFIVSKKVSNRAVIRNLVKRRFRAAYAELRHSLIPGYLILFIAHPSAIQVSQQDIQTQMKQVLKNSHLLSC